MSNLAIQRVLALPGTLAPSTLYIVRAADAALAELFFTNNDGSSVRHVLNKADVQAMIDGSTSGGADQLTTARTITATGDATWSVSFDGSANASAILTLAASGVGAGEYFAVTVDAKGRVTAGRALTAADIPSLPGSKINSVLSVDTTGNAATATKLAATKNINGVAFDGSANITVPAVDTATPRVAASLLGANNGIATLDGTGKVPASQLPSFVDDVVEAADLASFPVTGEASKIYLALDTNNIYRWSGSTYVSITAGAGASDTAVRLATARSISVTGDATWTVNFDGSANVTAALTLSNTAIAAGEHVVATYDAKGRAIAGRALIASDVPVLDFNNVSSSASVNLGTADW